MAFGFTIIAIIISVVWDCLLLQLTRMKEKKKEISIRKTLGASVGSISWFNEQRVCEIEFDRSRVIGCPVAWYLMGKFTEGYQYVTWISRSIFLNRRQLPL